ncbi:MAG: ABC transporter permease [Planctomycetota bacterium]|nr:ABC transporter permease [Planctomycetota bacterium]MEC8652231.1 ABC transporter permease [Planctomycetota bacterium]
MNILEATRLAVESIWANRLRSFLTLLGVIIGIAAIVATAAVIEGLNKYVADKLSDLGQGTFTVQRFGIITNRQDFLDAIRRNRRLQREDARAVRDLCTSAKEVAWQVRSTADVRRGDALLKSCEVGGITPEILEIEPFEVADGRVILPFEDDRAVPVAFIGNDVVEQLFGDVDPIGKELRIKGQPVRVVGTAVKKGSFLGFSQDNFIKIPYSLHRKLYGTTRSVRISVQAADSSRMEECMDEVRAILRARHHLRPKEDDDFDMLTAAGINDLWKRMTTTIFSIALFVVGISLVVGGIVIMNIMLVSVIERTREIGVRKAVGARQRDIVRQFLIESMLLSCIGGVIGVALAYGASWALRTYTPLPAEFPAWAPPVAFFVCAGIGVFFGISPARRAADLDPIEALRTE